MEIATPDRFRGQAHNDKKSLSLAITHSALLAIKNIPSAKPAPFQRKGN